MNLGSVIKKIRQERGQTQTEFAAASGITQTYLSQIESNTKEPNLSTLREISNAVNIPLPILMFLSLEKKDIDSEKSADFDLLTPKVKDLIHEFFGF